MESGLIRKETAVSESTSEMAGVMIDPVTGEIIDQKELAERLLAQAKEQGVSLVGPGGLLNQLTRNVLETALEAELTEHLGHEHGQTPIAANMRNGTRSKTVLTEIGPVEIEVPRDRDGSFEPVIVPKRKRRLDGIDQIVLSLSARGLTTGEIAAHFEEVYGARVSKDTISRITEKVAGELAEWSARPLDPIYPVLFVDAVVVKVRDGQVRNTPFYVVMGVTTNGEREILGIWAGDGGEGARFWLQVFSELKNRGVEDVLIAVCDGLKGLPEAITTTWERTVVQQCIVHLIRNSFRYAGRQHRDGIVKALKPVYTAPSEQAAKDRFAEFTAEWGQRYPAIVRLWESSWAEFVPFLEYGACRRMACPSPDGDGGLLVGVGRSARLVPAASASGGCRVDLPDVVGGGREVQLAAGCIKASPGESAQDRLEGSDAGFDGCAAALVSG
ncbi:transposase [Pseudarthrobacter phenanthrenivorans Sphe3]|uniref:Mutator family transposase n=12 Tax=Pseudarthrobacter TaxID=1742993 RepID=F0M7S3_PSEPM|nr:transposase [Pseudarthrobacter phenanthrenivorans Sphe3]